jgi:hypothetical protein
MRQAGAPVADPDTIDVNGSSHCQVPSQSNASRFARNRSKLTIPAY